MDYLAACKTAVAPVINVCCSLNKLSGNALTYCNFFVNRRRDEGAIKGLRSSNSGISFISGNDFFGIKSVDFETNYPHICNVWQILAALNVRKIFGV